jgi:pulcherriminic acid synthase
MQLAKEESGLPDLTSPEVVVDPYAFYRRLRAERPLHFDKGTGSYLITKHAAVSAGYRSPAFTTQNYEWQLEPVLGRTLLQFEGRPHSTKRALVSPYFRGSGLEKWTPAIMRNVSGLIEELVARNVDELLGHLVPGTQVDIMAEFGHFVPVYTMADVLALPKSDYAPFTDWYNNIIAFLGNLAKDPDVHERGLAATRELRAYMAPLVRSRRENPGDDLISALVLAEVDGQQLDDDEVLANISILLVAGSETTDKTLGSLFKHLLTDRANYQALLDDRELVTHAIGETLRVTPPSQMNGRILSEDVEIEGQIVPEGSWVNLVMASANRDEERFDHSEVFDMYRTDIDHTKAFTAAGEHFAFGYGRHFCLGAMLAKTQMEIAVNSVLDRFPQMRLADGFVPQDRGLKMRAPHEIQVLL